MYSNFKQSVLSISRQSSNPLYSVHLPLGGTFVLFVVAALLGGEVADRGLLPTVRFLSLIMLTLGLFASYMTGVRCAFGRQRWIVGQVSAGCTGMGAGFLWSGAAFGMGFLFLMVGALMGLLLIASQLQGRVKRRRLAVQAHRGTTTQPE